MYAVLKTLSIASLSILGLRTVKCSSDSADDDRGLGNFFNWVKFEDAFSVAKSRNKPVFMIIHKQTCPMCITLKERFSKSIRILDLSSEFVMVNVENDVQNGDDEKFAPDGKYVPRILFFTPNGDLIPDACNNACGDPEFKYFHRSPPSIVEAMRYVIQNRGKLF